MKFYPSPRRVVRDMYPALILMTCGVLLGVSNLIGTLEPRGAFASLMAWGATILAPFAVHEVFRPFWRVAAVVDESGVFWATTNNVETGYIPRRDITDVKFECVNGVPTLQISLASHDVLAISIRSSQSGNEVLASVRAILALT